MSPQVVYFWDLEEAQNNSMQCQFRLRNWNLSILYLLSKVDIGQLGGQYVMVMLTPMCDVVDDADDGDNDGDDDGIPWFFLPGVNFYRFNAKNWQFTV